MKIVIFFVPHPLLEWNDRWLDFWLSQYAVKKRKTWLFWGTCGIYRHIHVLVINPVIKLMCLVSCSYANTVEKTPCGSAGPYFLLFSG